MAKLQDLKFKITNETGEKLEFTSVVNVDSSGRFTMSLPEEIIEIVKIDKQKRDCPNPSIELVFSHSKHRLIGSDLDLIKKYLHSICQEYLSCEVKESMVILYNFITSCHYAFDKDGGIHSNGGEAKKHGGTYKWAETSPDTKEHYILGFRAIVALKQVYTRANSSKIKYGNLPRLFIDEKEKAGKVYESDLGDWGEKLNSFPNGWSLYNERGTKEMPYSEDMCKFFYEGMMSLCVLSHKMKTIFETPENILEASKNSFQKSLESGEEL